MNPSTAQARLLRDLLFNFAINSGHKCFRCGERLDRKTFSIEHIEDWLDSDDPIGKFFDVDNIAYSHLRCNVGASRTVSGQVRKHGLKRYNTYGCRCEICKAAKSKYNKLRKRWVGRVAQASDCKPEYKSSILLLSSISVYGGTVDTAGSNPVARKSVLVRI